GNELNESPGGIATEQRALRAFEHFDAIEIESAENLTLAECDVTVVDIDGDRGLGAIVEVVLGDAANGKQLFLAAIVAADIEAGRHGRNVGALVDAHLAQLLT